MNKKIRDVLFLLICIGSIFFPVPILYYSEFLSVLSSSDSFSTKLMFIPLILGMIYTLYCHFIKKDKSILVFSHKLAVFAVLYLALTYISLIWGFLQFPFFDELVHGINGFRQMGKVQTILAIIGIYPAHETLIMIMIALRIIKNAIFQFIWQFGGVYLIYCWYRNEPKRLLKLLTIGVTVLILIEVFNNFFEWFYFAGSTWAKNILEIITPFFHPVNLPDHPTSSHLLWPGQIRGTFTEPSYFGMFCAFALPILWYMFITSKYKRIQLFYGVLTLAMAFNIYLTSSRTAMGLYLGELVLLSILGVILHNKKTFVIVSLTLAINLLGLAMGGLFMNNIMSTAMVNRVTFGKEDSSYFERNLGSLTDINQRSNRSRYTIAMTHIRIGLDHPVLGIGYGLREPYVAKYLVGQTLSPEIEYWMASRERNSILAGAFPNLGDYWVYFAERGILGLLAYLTIPGILLIRLIKIVEYDKSILYGCILISLLGCMGIGFGDNMTILYVYWLILGVGFALSYKPDNRNLRFLE